MSRQSKSDPRLLEPAYHAEQFMQARNNLIAEFRQQPAVQTFQQSFPQFYGAVEAKSLEDFSQGWAVSTVGTGEDRKAVIEGTGTFPFKYEMKVTETPTGPRVFAPNWAVHVFGPTFAKQMSIVMTEEVGDPDRPDAWTTIQKEFAHNVETGAEQTVTNIYAAQQVQNDPTISTGRKGAIYGKLKPSISRDMHRSFAALEAANGDLNEGIAASIGGLAEAGFDTRNPEHVKGRAVLGSVIRRNVEQMRDIFRTTYEQWLDNAEATSEVFPDGSLQKALEAKWNSAQERLDKSLAMHLEQLGNLDKADLYAAADKKYSLQLKQDNAERSVTDTALAIQKNEFLLSHPNLLAWDVIGGGNGAVAMMMFRAIGKIPGAMDAFNDPVGQMESWYSTGARLSEVGKSLDEINKVFGGGQFNPNKISRSQGGMLGAQMDRLERQAPWLNQTAENIGRLLALRGEMEETEFSKAFAQQTTLLGVQYLDLDWRLQKFGAFAAGNKKFIEDSPVLADLVATHNKMETLLQLHLGLDQDEQGMKELLMDWRTQYKQAKQLGPTMGKKILQNLQQEAVNPNSGLLQMKPLPPAETSDKSWGERTGEDTDISIGYFKNLVLRGYRFFGDLDERTKPEPPKDEAK
jgi:hypothetical protein